MPQAFGISEFKPLSVGAVVTGAVQLYRDNFKQYLKIAFFSTLWLIVPVFGWAKGLAGFALISRLAFNEISGKSEDEQVARSIVDQRKWTFLGALLLLFLFYTLFYIGAISIALALGFMFGALGFASNPNPVFTALVFLLAFLVTFSAILWIVTRFFIQDVALAIEDGSGASGSLKRSWSLTKGSVFRLQLVILVGTLITGPFVLISQGVSFAFQSFSGVDANPLVALVLSFALIGITLTNSALLSPFWQAIKALVYADLLTRREGVDLELRG
ncbi:MAG: DUF975 domain-containing protein [Anaerolineae bacterium]|nr:DUF975 domain-containing protein [Gloeobacterales cyanobacterium ES-bin-313]